MVRKKAAALHRLLKGAPVHSLGALIGSSVYGAPP
jgi:hypothetical protein